MSELPSNISEHEALLVLLVFSHFAAAFEGRETSTRIPVSYRTASCILKINIRPDNQRFDTSNANQVASKPEMDCRRARYFYYGQSYLDNTQLLLMSKLSLGI